MYNERGGFLGSIPTVTRHLLIINVLLWLTSLALPKLGLSTDVYSLLSLHYWDSSTFWPIQVFSYMFLHSTYDVMHLLCNMFTLWMFGRIIEQTLGEKRYLVYYITCGIGAALVQQIVWSCLFMPELGRAKEVLESVGYVYINGIRVTSLVEFNNVCGEMLSHITTVGASGAVFGILLAFAFLYPNMEMFLLFVPIPIKAKYMVFFYALLELYLGVNNSASDNVAHFAHLGGMIFGVAMLLWWKKRGEINTLF